MSATAPRPRLVFPVAGWTRGYTFVQSLNRDPITGRYYIGRDENGSIELNEYDPSLRWLSSRLFPGAGHGSSLGVEHDGETWVWMDHEAKGTGRASYAKGQDSFKRYSVLPSGDISVHRDVACVRSGNRYRGYDLSDVKAGQLRELFDFSIPGWGNRFQGHSVVSYGDGNGLVCVHRDMRTKGESRAVCYDFKGNLVKTPADGKMQDYLDTTHMGDEAEGFLVETAADGVVTVWVVKRTGGNNRNRVVVATLWMGSLKPSPQVPVDTTTGIKRVFVLLGQPAAVKLSSVLKARKVGNTSRYTFYVQSWLTALGYYKGPIDGRWGKVTQAAFDTFRRNIKPKWPESDCVGAPAITSLALLRNAAVKKTGKDTLKVVK